MSDPLCNGLCMLDWNTGICTGCGRTVAEIEGESAETKTLEKKEGACGGEIAPESVA